MNPTVLAALITTGGVIAVAWLTHGQAKIRHAQNSLADGQNGIRVLVDGRLDKVLTEVVDLKKDRALVADRLGRVLKLLEDRDAEIVELKHDRDVVAAAAEEAPPWDGSERRDDGPHIPNRKEP